MWQPSEIAETLIVFFGTILACSVAIAMTVAIWIAMYEALKEWK